MRPSLALLAAVCLVCACDKKGDPPEEDEPTKRPKKSASAAPGDSGPKPKPSGVVIEVDPSGKAKVSGAGARTGDQKHCAAFDACCTASEASLFCGLAQADETDCTKLRDTVRAFLKESNVKPPPGCE